MVAHQDSGVLTLGNSGKQPTPFGFGSCFLMKYPLSFTAVLAERERETDQLQRALKIHKHLEFNIQAIWLAIAGVKKKITVL